MTLPHVFPYQMPRGFLVLGGMHSKGWVLDRPVLIRITPSYFLDRANLRIWAKISIHESTNGRTEPCRMEGEQTSPILLQARGRGVNLWTPPVLECRRSGEGLLHNGQDANSFASLLWGLEKALCFYIANNMLLTSIILLCFTLFVPRNTTQFNQCAFIESPLEEYSLAFGVYGLIFPTAKANKGTQILCS